MAESVMEQFKKLISGLREAEYISTELKETLDVAQQIYNSDQLTVNQARIALSIIEDMLMHHLDLDRSKVHVSYAPLHGVLAKYGIDLTHACKASGVPLNVRTKIKNNQSVQINTLNRLAVLLKCDVADMIEFISEKEMVERFLMGMRLRNTPNITSYTISAQYGENYKDNIDEDSFPAVRNLISSSSSFEAGMDELYRLFDLEDTRTRHEDYDEYE